MNWNNSPIFRAHIACAFFRSLGNDMDCCLCWELKGDSSYRAKTKIVCKDDGACALHNLQYLIISKRNGNKNRVFMLFCYGLRKAKYAVRSVSICVRERPRTFGNLANHSSPFTERSRSFANKTAYWTHWWSLAVRRLIIKQYPEYKKEAVHTQFSISFYYVCIFISFWKIESLHLEYNIYFIILFWQYHLILWSYSWTISVFTSANFFMEGGGRNI